MAEVIVVSNRGPQTFRVGPGGRPVPAPSGGGLAATLRPLLAGTDTTWVCAAMTEGDRQAAAEGLMTGDGLQTLPVALDEGVYTKAYDVVSNATLWFVHHRLFDLPRRPRYDRHWAGAWEAYREMNATFTTTVAHVADQGATVLVQDYHLSLMGAMLAEARPDLRTVHFTHTPFADPEGLRTLPDEAAAELIAGMAGFGACGFHTARWARAFRECLADPSLHPGGGSDGDPEVFWAPLGPDVEAIVAEAASEEAQQERARLVAEVGGRAVVARVDRIELSKNILRGFFAFEELLTTEPGWRGKVVMLALVYPSRQGLGDYLAYRSELEHHVERINARFGEGAWTPILLDVADNRSRSVAALTLYDVLLVNPVRDGLNLVAKEGPLVNRADGVLVLSREAGAFEELGKAALGVNPFDVTQTAAAIERALSMAPGERRERATALTKAVRQRSAADWLADQFAAAGALVAR